MRKSEIVRNAVAKYLRKHADKSVPNWELKRAAGDVCYWRAAVRDVRDAGMNIVSVKKGRKIVGYKFVRAH